MHRFPVPHLWVLGATIALSEVEAHGAQQGIALMEPCVPFLWDVWDGVMLKDIASWNEVCPAYWFKIVISSARTCSGEEETRQDSTESVVLLLGACFS